jgi:hypothetical protein
MNTTDLILVVLALATIIFGIVVEAEASLKSWAGWGLISIGAYALVQQLV